MCDCLFDVADEKSHLLKIECTNIRSFNVTGRNCIAERFEYINVRLFKVTGKKLHCLEI
uniref:Uncharacterized protein n=1 Tax=viral metagenome TaxID=1070528 RepID=A0A6C0C9D2_9ZZZZ